jgi:enterochelin esterase family protein
MHLVRTFGVVATAVMVAMASDARTVAAGRDALGEVLVEGEDWQVAVEGLGFADGLSYDRDGNVFFADLRGEKAGVYKLSPDGKKTRLYNTGRSGTRLGPDGRLYACGGKTLVAIDPADGKVTPLADGLGTNDLAVSKHGHVYITDTGKKQVTLVDSKTGQAKAADVGITAPNGIGLSPDHATLYVSDYGGTSVWAFKVNADGSLSDKRALMTMKAPANKPTVAGGDGMTIDSAGRVYVTTSLGLQVFDSEGQLLGVIPKPGDGPLVSAGFGGKELSDLYVACGDKLYRRKTRSHGAPPPPAYH